MATSRNAGGAHDEAAVLAQTGPVPVATDCAACHAPLPEGHRYLCAACVADSEQRAQAVVATLSVEAGDDAVEAADVTSDVGDTDELSCPNCGMPLDASGRCAGCVITVGR
jgi:hypothetical protein